ncbi:MAG: hypothetical protein LBB66_08735, partial [Desulfovibrio sp.]|nr:hypothetical protein [Desulfovibrio sp.]
MKLEFDTSVARSYKSNSQRARVLSEYWVGQNAFCPVCGNDKLSHYTANRPVADFFCENCEADFELKCHKEKSGKIHNKIVDGNYETIISRILSLKNPNFLFMTYTENTVSNFLFVP